MRSFVVCVCVFENAIGSQLKIAVFPFLKNCFLSHIVFVCFWQLYFEQNKANGMSNWHCISVYRILAGMQQKYFNVKIPKSILFWLEARAFWMLIFRFTEKVREPTTRQRARSWSCCWFWRFWGFCCFHSFNRRHGVDICYALVPTNKNTQQQHIGSIKYKAYTPPSSYPNSPAEKKSKMHRYGIGNLLFVCSSIACARIFVV